MTPFIAGLIVFGVVAIGCLAYQFYIAYLDYKLTMEKLKNGKH